MNPVRWVLVCVCLVALALPSTAVAAKKRKFSGPVGDSGAMIHFKTKVKRGDNRKVLLPVKVNDVPISCDQGDTVLQYEIEKGGPLKAIQVTDGAFSYTTPPNEQPPLAETLGEFVTRKQATGTFRSSGDFDANHTNCDTGLVSWSAKKK